MAAARAPFAEGREMRTSSSRMRRYAAEGSRLDNEHGPEWWLGQSARERAGGLEVLSRYRRLVMKQERALHNCG